MCKTHNPGPETHNRLQKFNTCLYILKPVYLNVVTVLYHMYEYISVSNNYTYVYWVY